MPPLTLTATETIALVFLAGFAIQQLLQILDPLLICGIHGWKDSRPNKDLPCGISEGDLKKSAMAALSFVLGVGTVLLTGIRLLTLLKPEYGGLGDILVSGLVVGSGTEAVNTVVKFLGYVKDAQKPPSELEVVVVPSSVTLKQGTTFKFRVSVKNGGTGVTWSVLHSPGGSIDSSGLYTAPSASGSYQVMAESNVDRSKFSVATVTVTA